MKKGVATYTHTHIFITHNTHINSHLHTHTFASTDNMHTHMHTHIHTCKHTTHAHTPHTHTTHAHTQHMHTQHMHTHNTCTHTHMHTHHTHNTCTHTTTHTMIGEGQAESKSLALAAENHVILIPSKQKSACVRRSRHLTSSASKEPLEMQWTTTVVSIKGEEEGGGEWATIGRSALSPSTGQFSCNEKKQVNQSHNQQKVCFVGTMRNVKALKPVVAEVT